MYIVAKLTEYLWSFPQIYWANRVQSSEMEVISEWNIEISCWALKFTRCFMYGLILLPQHLQNRSVRFKVICICEIYWWLISRNDSSIILSTFVNHECQYTDVQTYFLHAKLQHASLLLNVVAPCSIVFYLFYERILFPNSNWKDHSAQEKNGTNH